MKASDIDVASVAALAALELDAAQAEAFGAQLSRVLDAFAVIDAVDVEGVEPTRHVLSFACPRRADEPQASLPREALLRAAPESDGACFVVPRVID